jgi:phosphoglucosamine mutase
MKIADLEHLLNANRNTLKLLKDRRVLIIAGLPGGPLLDDCAALERNAGILEEAPLKACEILLTADFLAAYPCPALIDLKKAVCLYQDSTLPEKERASTALMMARVNFFGTDGIRGKVIAERRSNWVHALLEENVFTPALAETAAYSFARLLIENGFAVAAGTVVFANDGRDAANAWALSAAVARGFTGADLNVHDLGVVPTALVPYTMLRKGMRGGAMLTASHNPANQNGIKFFIDGKKMLPEGALGDYALSAGMYFHGCVSAQEKPRKPGSVTRSDSGVDDAVRLALSALPANAPSLFKCANLVLDTANGASAETAALLLKELGVRYTTKNEPPSGANINRGCGVAEIEGAERFEGRGYGGYIPFVQELFDLGRRCDAGTVYGLSLDGDGDRGFLLYYDKQADCVHVIDGDKCGYILAEYFVKTGKQDRRKRWFVSTIESDLLTAASAAKNLGVPVRVVSVGDKWIGTFGQGEILLGLEVSGHIIFPVRFRNEKGEEAVLLSGFGLLTGLLTLAAIKTMHLSFEKIFRPFEQGFSRTFYAFFVDKSKFYRGSGVWKDDAAIVERQVKVLKKEGGLPAAARLVQEDKEDPNVLYFSLVEKKEILGCVFMRNSGTEDKTATYVKGRPSLQTALLSIGRAVQENHLRQLKNKNRLEYVHEVFIMNALEQRGEVGMAEIKSALEKKAGAEIKESDLYSVVHGLKKEGRIVTVQIGGETRVNKAAVL